MLVRDALNPDRAHTVRNSHVLIKFKVTDSVLQVLDILSIRSLVYLLSVATSEIPSTERRVLRN